MCTLNDLFRKIWILLVRRVNDREGVENKYGTIDSRSAFQSASELLARSIISHHRSVIWSPSKHRRPQTDCWWPVEPCDTTAGDTIQHSVLNATAGRLSGITAISTYFAVTYYCVVHRRNTIQLTAISNVPVSFFEREFLPRNICFESLIPGVEHTIKYHQKTEPPMQAGQCCINWSEPLLVS